MNNNNRKFIGNEDKPALLPVYKGARRTYYPGQLALGKSASRSGIQGNSTKKARRAKNTALRRYVFKYENNTFVYLATRKGQRNGGFDSTPSKTAINVDINVAGLLITINQDFTFKSKIDGAETWQSSNESGRSRIIYDLANTRWVWQTRLNAVDPWYDNAFSSSTDNTLGNSGTINEVTWTYIANPYTTGTPQLPAIVTITKLFYYKNNSIDKLNKWPIQNVNADLKIKPDEDIPSSEGYKWQTGNNNSGRLPCLSDGLLFRCFEGIPLKPYDIVFVEIVWTFFSNKVRGNAKRGHGYGPPLDEVLKLGQFGYKTINGSDDGINSIEWWSPAPFKQESQKGRIYRIGKLEADTGIGGYDKVIFAQRTKIVTTRFQRGGFTALED